MTKQQLEDLEFYVQLRSNVNKIELAQQLLQSVHAPDVNTHLKEAMASLEKARQQNHTFLCNHGDRVTGLRTV